MKKIILITLALLTLAQTVHAGEWFTPFRRDDYLREIAYTTITVIDWRQTQILIEDNKYVETNIFLGSGVTRSEVDTMVPIAIAAHWLITWALPRDKRLAWQWFWIGIETGAVSSNYGAGIRLSF